MILLTFNYNQLRIYLLLKLFILYFFNFISLRPYSLLTFAKNDGNFAVCFDYNEKKIYYVPAKKILDSKPEPGEALKVSPNGTFHVDYTAILAEENKIDEYLKECTLAK